MRNTKIMICAGEISGDLYGASLVEEIHQLSDRTIEFFGSGGKRMARAGVELISELARFSAVGTLEVLPSVVPLKREMNRLEQELKRRGPELLVLIDNQGFNWQLAKRVKDHDLKIVYYFPPHVWLFNRRSVRRYVQTFDRIISILPMEYEVYRQAGGNVTYVGHPLLDIVRTALAKVPDREVFLHRYGLDDAAPIISLIPGSRRREITLLLPTLLTAAERLATEQQAQFLFPVADRSFLPEIEAPLSRTALSVHLIFEDEEKYAALSHSDLLIGSSGTVTLEAAILEVPMVACYRSTHLTYWVAKYLYNIRYISMPNLLLDERVMPELVHPRDLNGDALAREGVRLLNDQEARDRIVQGYRDAVAKLGAEGAVTRAANVILEMVG
ncbi:MAG: lipid-A-disaccharide synthase [Candidatus Bipolaricaulia bacterium]